MKLPSLTADSASEFSRLPNKFARLPNKFSRSSNLIPTVPVGGEIKGTVLVRISTTATPTTTSTRSATAGVTINASAKGHFTYFAIANVTISASASAQRIINGTANIGVEITASASGEAGTTHAGTANIGVTISATASGTASQTHSGTASCQVNLSASAAANVSNYLYESDVLSISNNLLWLRADDIDGDDDKTDNPSDNTSISSWVSRNNGLTVSCTSGLEPTFQTNENGTLPAVKFDSTDELYVDWDSSMTNFTVFLVVKNYDSAAPGGYIMDGGQASSSRLGWLDRSTGNFRMGGVANFSEVLSESGQSADTDWHIITAHYNGANSSLRVDLSAADSGDIGASNGTYAASEGIVIGGANHSNLYGSKILVAEVLAYSGGLSTSDRDKVEGYLNDKWSITTIHSGTASCQVNLSASASGSVSTPPAAFNNYSASFDGTDDLVEVDGFNANTVIGNGEFTVSLWCKFDTLNNFDSIVYMGSENSNTEYFQLRLRDVSGLKYQISARAGNSGNATVEATTTPATGSWVHLAYTRSGTGTGTTAKIYVNGTLEGTGTNGEFSAPLGASSSDTITDLSAFRSSTYSQYGIDGKIDEVAIWDSALSATEITKVYNSGEPFDLTSNDGNYTSSADLQGYWRFEDNTVSGSNGTIADSSGNSRTATTKNGVTFSTDLPS